MVDWSHRRSGNPHPLRSPTRRQTITYTQVLLVRTSHAAQGTGNNSQESKVDTAIILLNAPHLALLSKPTPTLNTVKRINPLNQAPLTHSDQTPVRLTSRVTTPRTPSMEKTGANLCAQTPNPQRPAGATRPSSNAPSPSPAHQTTGPAWKHPSENDITETIAISPPYRSSQDSLPYLMASYTRTSMHRPHSGRPMVKPPETAATPLRPRPGTPRPY